MDYPRYTSLEYAKASSSPTGSYVESEFEASQLTAGAPRLSSDGTARDSHVLRYETVLSCIRSPQLMSELYRC